MPEKQSGDRGISSSKKNKILQNLALLMPENRRKFFENLTVNDESVDLVTEQEE